MSIFPFTWPWNRSFQQKWRRRISDLADLGGINQEQPSWDNYPAATEQQLFLANLETSGQGTIEEIEDSKSNMQAMISVTNEFLKAATTDADIAVYRLLESTWNTCANSKLIESNPEGQDFDNLLQEYVEKAGIVDGIGDGSELEEALNSKGLRVFESGVSLEDRAHAIGSLIDGRQLLLKEDFEFSILKSWIEGRFDKVKDPESHILKLWEAFEATLIEGIFDGILNPSQIKDIFGAGEKKYKLGEDVIKIKQSNDRDTAEFAEGTGDLHEIFIVKQPEFAAKLRKELADGDTNGRDDLYENEAKRQKERQAQIESALDTLSKANPYQPKVIKELIELYEITLDFAESELSALEELTDQIREFETKMEALKSEVENKLPPSVKLAIDNDTTLPEANAVEDSATDLTRITDAILKGVAKGHKAVEIAELSLAETYALIGKGYAVVARGENYLIEWSDPISIGGK